MGSKLDMLDIERETLCWPYAVVISAFCLDTFESNDGMLYSRCPFIRQQSIIQSWLHYWKRLGKRNIEFQQVTGLEQKLALAKFYIINTDGDDEDTGEELVSWLVL